MKTYAIDNIRNLALISHGGAGKTSLAEALLYSSGAINRLGTIEAGNTTTDYDPDEIKRQVTINTTLAPLEWNSVKINLLDAPYYFDFVGDVVGALRKGTAPDSGLCCFRCGGGHGKMWSYADDMKLPRAVFINKMDRKMPIMIKQWPNCRNSWAASGAFTDPDWKESSLKELWTWSNRQATCSLTREGS